MKPSINEFESGCEHYSKAIKTNVNRIKSQPNHCKSYLKLGFFWIRNEGQAFP